MIASFVFARLRINLYTVI